MSQWWPKHWLERSKTFCISNIQTYCTASPFWNLKQLSDNYVFWISETSERLFKLCYDASPYQKYHAVLSQELSIVYPLLWCIFHIGAKNMGMKWYSENFDNLYEKLSVLYVKKKKKSVKEKCSTFAFMSLVMLTDIRCSPTDDWWGEPCFLPTVGRSGYGTSKQPRT